MDVPEFARDSSLLEGAFRLAQAAHHGPRRADGTNIEHPVAVAELLSAEGYDEEVVAAGLLHDVVEDTATDVREIEERFGLQVARLVRAMTENPRIEPYEHRKAEHRERVARDRSVAAIYAADKLAGARSMRDDPESVAEPRLQHYVASFNQLCKRYPDLPFLAELRSELERLERARETGGDG
jgi:(p)ppGpp synthase/HD superfamily hydrolase